MRWWMRRFWSFRWVRSITELRRGAGFCQLVQPTHEAGCELLGLCRVFARSFWLTWLLLMIVPIQTHHQHQLEAKHVSGRRNTSSGPRRQGSTYKDLASSSRLEFFIQDGIVSCLPRPAVSIRRLGTSAVQQRDTASTRRDPITKHLEKVALGTTFSWNALRRLNRAKSHLPRWVLPLRRFRKVDQLL